MLAALKPTVIALAASVASGLGLAATAEAAIVKPRQEACLNAWVDIYWAAAESDEAMRASNEVLYMFHAKEEWPGNSYNQFARMCPHDDYEEGIRAHFDLVREAVYGE